jgi:hypothetical protein
VAYFDNSFPLGLQTRALFSNFDEYDDFLFLLKALNEALRKHSSCLCAEVATLTIFASLYSATTISFLYIVAGTGEIPK